ESPLGIVRNQLSGYGPGPVGSARSRIVHCATSADWARVHSGGPPPPAEVISHSLLPPFPNCASRRGPPDGILVVVMQAWYSRLGGAIHIPAPRRGDSLGDAPFHQTRMAGWRLRSR